MWGQQTPLRCQRPLVSRDCRKIDKEELQDFSRERVSPTSVVEWSCVYMASGGGIPLGFCPLDLGMLIRLTLSVGQ